MALAFFGGESLRAQNPGPVPSSVGTTISLPYQRPPAFEIDRNLVGSVRLLRSAMIDTAAVTATLPVYLGHMRGDGDSAFVFLHYFGGSVAPTPGYTVKDMASDALKLGRQLQIDRYTLVGHSMGGKIALAVAARAPAGLESLVLLAPSPSTAEPITAADRARLLGCHSDRDAARETACMITARPVMGADSRASGCA